MESLKEKIERKRVERDLINEKIQKSKEKIIRDLEKDIGEKFVGPVFSSVKELIDYQKDKK